MTLFRNVCCSELLDFKTNILGNLNNSDSVRRYPKALFLNYGREVETRYEFHSEFVKLKLFLFYVSCPV